MKKKILIAAILLACIPPVHALSKNFSIDTSIFSPSSNAKKSSIASEFNQDYDITYNISSPNNLLKEEISTLSKKVTYLLLGEGNTQNETAEEYYKRKKDYLNLRYNPSVPQNPDSSLDKNSQEYQDDIVSGFSVPGMFNLIDELNVTYSTVDSIRISANDNMIISLVSLPNVSLKKEDEEHPLNYTEQKTNLVMYYYFKKLDNEYKLYYLFGETTDDLNSFFSNIEESESTKSISISQNYDSNLVDIYDFSRLQALAENKINDIYNNNYQNVLILNAYYNTSLVKSANGFLLSDGLVVTSWSFLEYALINSQYFVIKNADGTTYDIEGIVSIYPENGIAVIKLKDKVKSTTVISSTDNIKVEDPVITISSKTGVSLAIQTGIITSKDDYIQSTLPLTETDAGSPLYNEEGQVIGMNTDKYVNTSLSLAVDTQILSEIQTKLNDHDFSMIDSIPFQELKEKYYYTKSNEEKVINTIPKSKWKEFKKIGKLESSIKLELLKASYDKNVISLRYNNSISKYISGMQLASSFKEELKKSGFEETLNSRTKCIYQNNKYKVIIMDELSYLIVVMVKL